MSPAAIECGFCGHRPGDKCPEAHAWRGGAVVAVDRPAPCFPEPRCEGPGADQERGERDGKH